MSVKSILNAFGRHRAGKTDVKRATTHGLLVTLAGTLLALTASSTGRAGTAEYCVTCSDPDKTYLCRLETPFSNHNNKGLQLFCIVRTSKEGGHRSCAISATATAKCSGELKFYSFQVPDDVKKAIKRYHDRPHASTQTELAQPSQGGDEPKTLIDLTKRSVGASKEGLKKSGHAVVGAANKVGSATKKTGGAVTSAAKSAWDCVKSLFKDCSSEN
jgi:hypothetical protein